MTEAPRRTKKELAKIEQEKAHAFRAGIAAYKAGASPQSCPFPEEHRKRAWLRGYEAERKLREEINPRERRA